MVRKQRKLFLLFFSQDIFVRVIPFSFPSLIHIINTHGRLKEKKTINDLIEMILLFHVFIHLERLICEQKNGRNKKREKSIQSGASHTTTSSINGIKTSITKRTSELNKVCKDENVFNSYFSIIILSRFG